MTYTKNVKPQQRNTCILVFYILDLIAKNVFLSKINLSHSFPWIVKTQGISFKGQKKGF